MRQPCQSAAVLASHPLVTRGGFGAAIYALFSAIQSRPNRRNSIAPKRARGERAYPCRSKVAARETGNRELAAALNDTTEFQNVVDDSSRQWWVADGRFSLIRPFYGLRIAPILPEDSGLYRCRLETDPLFALTMSTASVELAVMGKLINTLRSECSCSTGPVAPI